MNLTVQYSPEACAGDAEDLSGLGFVPLHQLKYLLDVIAADLIDGPYPVRIDRLDLVELDGA